MFKKISQIASWNILSAFLNFGLNFILARQLGNSFFGEFSLYNAKIALLGLIFIIIPTNFAVVKFQDDTNFKTIYFSFYILASLAFLGILIVAFYIGYVNLPIYSMFLYSWPLFFISFFDTALQATNNLKHYFKILFIISLVKLLIFVIFYYLELVPDINAVILSVGAGNTLCVLGLIFYYRNSFFNSVKIVETIKFVKQNFSNFRGYYFSTIIKSLADNFFILVFNGILNKSQLGLFSLFIKAQSFSFSLFRILEAFLMNRENNTNYFSKIDAKKHVLGFLLLVITFVISIIYMYSLNSKIYLIESLLISLCAFPYVYLLLVRSKLLLSYTNKALNMTIIVEMLIMLLFYFFLNLYAVNGTVLICLCFVLFSNFFRVIFLKFVIANYFIGVKLYQA